MKMELSQEEIDNYCIIREGKNKGKYDLKKYVEILRLYARLNKDLAEDSLIGTLIRIFKNKMSQKLKLLSARKIENE